MLGVIGNRFSIGKETYHPFSAELHYFRIDKKYWSICFERIKRAGFGIISSAVPWNIHQDETKHFDFAGLTDPRKDLIVFLELAREFGFKVILRPGPLVCGQLENGGLPKYLFNDINIFSRDAQGLERRLPEDYGVSAGYLPSFLHRNFQYHLRNYFKAFVEATKNYVHPRGPIFMVELDFETSFGRLLEPDSADYNPTVLEQYYAPFLLDKYEEIKKLNAQYKEKNDSFESVQPPRKFTDLDIKDYPKVFDWYRFRENLLNLYLQQLEDIFTSYTVEPLMFRSLYFRQGDLLPAFNLVPEDRSPFLGANVFPEGNYFDFALKARFLQAEYGFAFATSFVSGAGAAEPEREEEVAPIKPNTRRFYLAAGLSSGFKGFNHYMFVDRDHWYGAPLHNDGTVSDGYALTKKFSQAIAGVGLEEMEASADIAVVGNRLYSWLAGTSSKKAFTYVNRLLYESSVGFCRDLMRLKLNFGVRENRNFETLTKYKMLFIPTTEVMAKRDQEAIIDLAKAGVTILLCGLMPKYDEGFKDCQVLANHFRIKTSVDDRIGSVTHKNGSFPAYIYGTIRSTDDSKVKKLVKVDAKVVGVCSSRFKGNLYFFAFDIASGGNHQKLTFLESVLLGEKIESYLYCSDPSVDISFQMGSKRGLLFVVAPPPGELSDGFEAGHKEIIIKADLREAGLKAAKLKLTDIYAGEDDAPMKLTAKELRDGIPVDIQFPDGKIFIVEKRA
ncbi:MAG: beta-galactosidase [candidate division Zixibacteria bacterium]|nr:beta-galactosidase [candidate division Zixibacteria bacterium]